MSFPDLIEAFLRERGVNDSEREGFLNPDYDSLYDPLLLPDMEKARDRVISAMKSSEHVVVYSDYDADGIPGAVVLKDFFARAQYTNISFYIPHRHNEGFGLNIEALEECAARGARLMVTVDCGTADAEEVTRANELGIDVIITDHHESVSLPEAYAVVNPKRKDSNYPFKELCGSAVAYKLVQAILEKENFGVKRGMEKWSLDMVGIATLSDMVPLVGENRILAKFGLEVLRKTPRPGIAALLRKLKIEQKHITEDDIGFMLTPRINAASRMGVPMDAFNLLGTDDALEAERLAYHLEGVNNERKGLVASTVKEAKKHLSLREKIGDVIVVGNPEWRPALLGLVANSLVEEYSRPVFVWGRDGDGVLKGSCRSYNDCDLHSLMGAVEGVFLEYGGHAGAGGFSVAFENLINLEEKLSEAFGALKGQTLSTDSQGLTLGSAIQISVKDISEELWNAVSLFSPFGTGNPKPIFAIKGEIKSVRQFGKDNNHLEITLSDGNGRQIKGISFFSSPSNYSVLPVPGISVSVLANLEKSYFRNAADLRLRIVDIKS